LQITFNLSAVLGISVIFAFATADDDIKATLPGMEEPTPTFDACVKLGPYDLLCLTAQERAVATIFHCVQLLHISGEHGHARYGLIANANKVSFAFECTEHMMHILSILNEPAG
jgi:hypothetical protein